MTTFAWIVLGGVAMSAIAMVGSATLLIGERTLQRIVRPLVAFAAGSLLGGAFLHMLPGALEQLAVTEVFLWVLVGFVVFFALEQFLYWQHDHGEKSMARHPMSWLILIGDGLHNLLGGLAVGGAFIVDIRLGITAWLAAAAHEVPQELGDFAVLVHAGWKRTRALAYNVLSALTFLLGGIISYTASFQFDVAFLLPFAAGNFIYIAASDLVPEVKHSRDLRTNALHFVALLAGMALLYLLRMLLG
jgi:zinc and cadmium transporter